MSMAEGIGIGFGSAVVLLLVLGGGAYLFKSNSAAGVVGTSIGGIASTFFFAIASFIPFGLLMFGFISDIMNQEFRSSFISLVAIGGIIFWRVVGGFISGSMQLDLTPIGDTGTFSQTGWCTLPGMEGLENPFIPMTFISSGTIIFFYLLESMRRSMGQNTSLFVGLFGTLAAQVIAFGLGGCNTKYYPIFGSISVNILAASIFGLLLAIISHFSIGSRPDLQAFQGFSPTSSPNGPMAPGYSSRGPVAPGSRGPPPSSATCSAEPGDDNTFVAELYKNGQLVTDKLAN